MDWGLIATVSIAVMVMIVCLTFLFRSGSGPSVDVGGVFDRIGTLAKAAQTARTLVLAAEQLYKTGQMQEGDRFDYVFQRLEEYFPGLDADALTSTIEAAVHWLKIVRGEEAQPAMDFDPIGQHGEVSIGRPTSYYSEYADRLHEQENNPR